MFLGGAALITVLFGILSLIKYERENLLKTYIFSTYGCRPYIWQKWNSVNFYNLSLKYKRLSSSGCKKKWIRNLEF